MSVEEIVTPKKSKRSKTHHGEPRNPTMVLMIVEWRDREQKTWQAIGKEFSITRAGARHLYHKWYQWAKSPPLSPKA